MGSVGVVKQQSDLKRSFSQIYQIDLSIFIDRSEWSERVEKERSLCRYKLQPSQLTYTKRQPAVPSQTLSPDNYNTTETRFSYDELTVRHTLSTKCSIALRFVSWSLRRNRDESEKNIIAHNSHVCLTLTHTASQLFGQSQKHRRHQRYIYDATSVRPVLHQGQEFELLLEIRNHDHCRPAQQATFTSTHLISLLLLIYTIA